MSGSKIWTRLLKFIKWTVIVLLILLVIAGLNLQDVVFPFFYLLLFGWISYLSRVAPQITFNAEIAFDAAVLLALAILGLHLILSRWRKGRAAASPKWRFGWTVKISAMVLLLFATSIAATGIVHQTGWFFAEKHLIKNAAIGEQTRELSNMKQLSLAMRLYADDHQGRYPARAGDVIPGYMTEKLYLYTWRGDGEPPEPITYYTGYGSGDPPDVIILASPRPFRSALGDRRVVIRADTSGSVIPESEFQSQIQKQNTKAH